MNQTDQHYIFNPYNETNLIIHDNYISTEFFYNLLPCYFYLCTSIYQFYKLANKMSMLNSIDNQIKEKNNLPQKLDNKKEILEKDLLGESSILEEKLKKQFFPSYAIKLFLTLVTFLTFLFSIIFAQISTPKIFKASQYKLHSLFYLAGCLSWGLNYKILQYQFKIKEDQNLACRIFWTFSCSLAIIRTFQASELPILNILFNSLKLVDSIILSLYAIYKPFDIIANDQSDIFHNRQEYIPKLVQQIFDKIENSQIFGKIIGFKVGSMSSNGLFPLSNIELKNLGVGKEDIENQYEMYLEQISLNEGESQEQKINTVQQEKFLFNQLPQNKAVAINKKIIEKSAETSNQKIKLYYQIITNIDSEMFKVERRYKQFIELEQDLKLIYNNYDYPYLSQSIPQFQKTDFKVNEKDDVFIQRRAQILENFIQNILQKPQYMCPKVIQFLQLSEEISQPYLNYFNFISREISKKKAFQKLKTESFQISQQQKQMQLSQNENEKQEQQSQIQQNQKKILQSFQLIEKQQQIYQHFHFVATCQGFRKSQYGNTHEFIIIIQNLYKVPKQEWLFYYKQLINCIKGQLLKLTGNLKNLILSWEMNQEELQHILIKLSKTLLSIKKIMSIIKNFQIKERNNQENIQI